MSARVSSRRRLAAARTGYIHVRAVDVLARGTVGHLVARRRICLGVCARNHALGGRHAVRGGGALSAGRHGARAVRGRVPHPTGPWAVTPGEQEDAQLVQDVRVRHVEVVLEDRHRQKCAELHRSVNAAVGEARTLRCMYSPPTWATWRPNCTPICAVASFIMPPEANGMPPAPHWLSEPAPAPRKPMCGRPLGDAISLAAPYPGGNPGLA